jgi:hypothetical protein
MAQASKRATAAAPRPVMYDDEPSSMSLGLFGYHGVVVDGDHNDVDSGAALPGGLQLAFFDDNFKQGAGCGPADYYNWAGYGGGGSGASSSSSVLSFEQADSGGRHLAAAYSTAGGDEDCAMWMDAAAGMVDHPATCNIGFVSPRSSADHNASRVIQELGSVQPPAKAARKRARPVITLSTFNKLHACMHMDMDILLRIIA